MLKPHFYCHSILFHLLFQIKSLCHRQQKWPFSSALCPVRWGKADITHNPATPSYYFFSSYSDFTFAAAIFTPSYVPVCVTVCVMCLTSSTLDGAVLPAAVCPDVEILRLPLLLTAPVLGCVQGHGVLIVDFVALVVKQQHLDHNEEEVEEREAVPAVIHL